jgi:transcription elongation factor Elf1
MNIDKSIVIGHAYTTPENHIVTALIPLSRDRAIFVTDAYYTPFVAWSYYFVGTDDDRITVFSGKYYYTLEEAMTDNHVPGAENFKKTWSLELTFYCPVCKTEHTHDINLEDCSIVELSETVEDYRIICPHCRYGMFLGATKATIKDGNDSYSLPLYQCHAQTPCHYNDDDDDDYDDED